MNQKILLYIGITAFNEEQNIGTLLDAVLAQDNSNFDIAKIIVISDGSTDNTVNIVKSKHSSKIKLIAYLQRKGPHARLNEILDLLPTKYDGLLTFEADTMPQDKYFIKKLVEVIPKDQNFSLAMGVSQPVRPNNWFSSVLNYGLSFKYEVFENAMPWPNLYLASTSILSRKFISKFHWDENYHDDSYSYRKAIESNLPILRNSKAVIYFKPVDNFRDYILQSTKFTKAQKKESTSSEIYSPPLNYLSLLKTTLKYLVLNPVLFLTYGFCLLVGRLSSIFMPEYSSLWKIYTSSKKLNV